MKLFLMGLTASGKSYQSRRLADRFNLTYISGSELLLRRLDYAPRADCHFWLEAIAHDSNVARRAPAVDRDVDENILTLARTTDNIMVDSWTVSYLYGGRDAIRIYLNASLVSRAQMAYQSKTDKSHSVHDLGCLIDALDQANRQRFMTLYGFDIFDTSIFDLVFDNSRYAKHYTARVLADFVMSVRM